MGLVSLEGRLDKDTNTSECFEDSDKKRYDIINVQQM